MSQYENELDAINDLMSNGEYDEAFRRATALDQIAPGYGCYHLGIAYHLGWGVNKSISTADRYYERALKVDTSYTAWVYYMRGMIAFNETEILSIAEENFREAERRGLDDAKVQLATVWASQAADAMAEATRQISPAATAQHSVVAGNLYIAAQNKYCEVIKNDASEMEVVHWVCLGRCAQSLYNLAIRGVMSIGSAGIGGYVDLISSTGNNEYVPQYKQNLRDVCEVMDNYNQSVVAEYFRIAADLLECETRRSAEALYKAKWHFKYIGELRIFVEPETMKEITSYVAELDETYDKLEKKYGLYITNMIRNGQLPNIADDYNEGKAPDPASCENFMKTFNATRSAPAQPQKKKGLLGFLGL